MNNETKILAMSLLAILKNTDNDLWIYGIDQLDILKKFNQNEEKYIDDETQEEKTKYTVKDKELQTKILEQEKSIKEHKEKVTKYVDNNKKNIETLRSVLTEIVGLPKENGNIPF